MSKKTLKEPPNLDKLDWRYHAATTLAGDVKNPKTGTIHNKGEIVTTAVEVSYIKGSIWLDLPNTTAMFLNLSNILFKHAKNNFNSSSIQKIQKIRQSTRDDNFFDFYENLFGSIVFAFTAIESFANEYIPDDFNYERNTKDDLIENMNKREIERKVPLSEKISNILPYIFNIKFTKQKKIWHEYKKLEEIRDRIIHMKSQDRKSSSRDKKTIWNSLMTDPIFNAPKISEDLIFYFINSLSYKMQPRWYKKYPF